jgi:hypothetical protein
MGKKDKSEKKERKKERKERRRDSGSSSDGDVPPVPVAGSRQAAGCAGGRR